MIKGQKSDVTKGRNVRELDVIFGWQCDNPGIGIDAAGFVLSERGRCELDEHFVFYGNPHALGGAVTHSASGGEGREKLRVSLPDLPEGADKIAMTVTIYEGEQQGYTMSNVSGLYIRLVDTAAGEEICRFDYGAELDKETAVVAGELYRHQGEWKFRAVGSGFFGGLRALCESFGLEVREEENAVSEAAAAAEPLMLSTIDLRKKTVGLLLEKKKLSGIVARVGLVLDITGSMRKLYNNGTVQEVVERILAIACKFDDNGELDVWVYDHEFSRLPSVTERDFAGYVQSRILGDPSVHKFGRNNEPLVMEDIVRKYTKEEPDSTPVFIIFINDGGVVNPTKKTLTEAAVHPIFWQFVGIGDSDFEVLSQLDTLPGRVVDNANFFPIADITTITDEELYGKLLNEFPLWLKEAKAIGILR